jgi:hypothetical protein
MTMKLLTLIPHAESVRVVDKFSHGYTHLSYMDTLNVNRLTCCY